MSHSQNCIQLTNISTVSYDLHVFELVVEFFDRNDNKIFVGLLPSSAIGVPQIFGLPPCTAAIRLNLVLCTQVCVILQQSARVCVKPGDCLEYVAQPVVVEQNGTPITRIPLLNRGRCLCQPKPCSFKFDCGKKKKDCGCHKKKKKKCCGRIKVKIFCQSCPVDCPQLAPFTRLPETPITDPPCAPNCCCSC
jgi:hypothetical protein